jgi:type I restriction enzyme M protein
VGNIVAGNTLSDDGHAQRRFDYMLSNPPFPRKLPCCM